MANTENIEAKLCAYVDGDLDDAGRAEIEAHLATNPQHRQLLEELKAQHAMLSGLPRARAPEDLSDAFQAQLERSGLLDESHATAPIAGRINRTPQIFAAAAVLLLAVGLVAVILMVLPARRHSSRLAMESKAPASTPSADSRRLLSRSPVAAPRAPGGPSTRPMNPEAISTLADADRLTEASHDRALAKNEGTFADRDKMGIAIKSLPASAAPSAPKAPIASKSPPSPDVFASKGGASQSGNSPVQSYTNIFAANQQLDEETAGKLKQLPGVPADAPVIVVASDDPTAADRQVQQYLTANNIRWEPLTEPMPSPIDLSQNQSVAPVRLQNEIGLRLKSGSQVQQQQKRQIRAAEQTVRSSKGQASGAFQQQLNVPKEVSAEAPKAKRGADEKEEFQATRGNVAISGSASQAQPPASAAATTAPSGGFSAQQPLAPPNQPRHPAETAAQQPIVAAPTTQPEMTQPHVILARGLTAKQISELNRAFSDNAIVTFPTTAPAIASVAVSTTQLSPTSQPAVTELSGLANGQATVANPSTQPRDRAGSGRLFAKQISGNAPVPAGEATSSIPATQPAAQMNPATRPASDLRVDVLIYVQPAPSAGQQIALPTPAVPSSATQPTTTPAP